MTTIPEGEADDIWKHWTVEFPLDFKVDETYIVRAHHDEGFWADFLITVLEKTEQGDWRIRLDTMLDGSPGMVDGYMQGLSEVS